MKTISTPTSPSPSQAQVKPMQVKPVAKDLTSVPFLSREEQHQAYGIDCGNAILFAGGTWGPGSEYTKKICVKNVSNHTIKFKYELPQTKFFSMDFPQLTTLSPGNATTLTIVFRPVNYESYDDGVRFKVHIVEAGVSIRSGTFGVRVLANVAILSSSMPSRLNFPFCPTNELSTETFSLKNDGQIHADFSWTLPPNQPFELAPASGILAPGALVTITASFRPKVAQVVDVTAAFTLVEHHHESEKNSSGAGTGQTEHKTLVIHGIGKYTHLQTSRSRLDFGTQIIGTPDLTQTFDLINPSLVRATFSIVALDHDQDESSPVFRFRPTKGVLGPGESTLVSVTYVPQTHGDTTCDHFAIETPGGNILTMTCCGKAVGPRVTLWKKNRAMNLVPGHSVNFGDLAVGSETTRVLILRNESNEASRGCLAKFQLMTQADASVFRFDRVSGVLAPNLDTSVTLSFCPRASGNFYRRVFVLVEHELAQYVDVLGSGYTPTSRPCPFHQGHVNAYVARIQNKLHLAAPDDLEKVLAQQNVDADDQYRDCIVTSSQPQDDVHDDERTTVARSMTTRSGEATVDEIARCDAFFQDFADAISVDTTALDFGTCSTVSVSEKKRFYVTNHTSGKVTCAWTSSGTGRESENHSAFDVYPTSQDIGPGKTVEFKAAFRPTYENAYYFAQLEAHVYFKSNRTFRLVNAKTFTPPWCTLVNVFGTTFRSTAEQFLPKVEFATPKICFPACHVGDKVFQTVAMNNHGDTPALFQFTGYQSSIFQVKPECGLIPANAFQLIQVQFSPTKVHTYTHKLLCRLNNVMTISGELDVFGIGCLPRVALGSSTVVVKPTATGLTSRRTFELKNVSRIPLVFRWTLPLPAQAIWHLSPTVHRLNGNERMHITCDFAPSSEQEFRHVSQCHVKAIAAGSTINEHVPVIQKSALQLMGLGTTGAVSFSPNNVEFDTILVNSSQTQHLFLVNMSDCDLEFQLETQLHPDSELNVIQDTLESKFKVTKSLAEIESQASASASLLHFSISRGTLPARSHEPITVTFTPNVSGKFVFQVECQISQARGTAPTTCFSCQMKGSASFPTLIVKDVYTTTPQSSGRMWAQLGLEHINGFLQAPLTRDELRLNHRSTPNLDDIQDFEFGFLPQPQHSPEQVIVLQLLNPGFLSVDFSIRYPNESEIEIERWADEGEPTAEQLRQNAIIDSKLFQVEPRRGKLEPGETIALTLTYSFQSMQYQGHHDIPILFRVDKGKQFVLNVTGRTLMPKTPWVFLTEPHTTLAPVPIGQTHAVVQRVNVFNVSNIPIHYSINVDEILPDLCQENHGMDIWTCLDPVGSIAPKSCASIRWIFAPIEDKLHHVQGLLLTYQSMSCGSDDGRAGNTQAFTLSGRGYHPKAMPPFPISIPPHQTYFPPQQWAALNTNEVHFKHVPTQSTQYAMLYLRGLDDDLGSHDNIRRSTMMTFRWDESHPLLASGVVKFYPVEGKITSGQVVAIKVTMTTTDLAQVIAEDFCCIISKAETPVEHHPHHHHQHHLNSRSKARLSSSSRSNYGQPSIDDHLSSRESSSSDSAHRSVVFRHTASSIRLLGLDSPHHANHHSMLSTNHHHHQSSSQHSGSSSTHRRRSLSNHSRDQMHHHHPHSGKEKEQQYLHVHVFAHIIAQVDYTRLYDNARLMQHILIATPYHQSWGTGLDSPSPKVEAQEILEQQYQTTCVSNPQVRECQQVLLDVFADVFQDLVQDPRVEQARLAQQPDMPAVVFTQLREDLEDDVPAPWTTLETLSQNAECQKLVLNLVENTVFNLVQEIACGDFNPKLKIKKFILSPSKPKPEVR